MGSAKLLARHAPGLAPAPVCADLDAAPATIEMTWLPGTELGGPALSPAQTQALAVALDRSSILTEHISVWSDARLNADDFLALFDLTGAEAARVHVFRCLAALFWLILLRPGGPASARNPPGTLQRQAARLLTLLNGHLARQPALTATTHPCGLAAGCDTSTKPSGH
jgi:hypothetical protein